jgi:formate dehydrogenase subunit gamma
MKSMARRVFFFSRVLSILVLCVAFVPGSVAQQSTQSPQLSPAEREIQRQQTQPLNNEPVWGQVREGKPQYTSIPGRETGVLIQTYGETWRQLKNAWITPIAGWLIAAVVVLIGLFYQWRGSITVESPPTGRLIRRFTPFERYMHWTVAITFSILGISGLIMMLGKYVLLPVIGYTLFAWLAQLSKHLHNFAGPLFAVSVVIMIVLWAVDNLPRAYDFKWFAKLGGMISREHVPSGRFNAGEKIWFWLGVVVLSLVVSASGFVLNFPNFDQVRAIMIDANVVHAVAAGLVMAISLGHIYLGTIGLKGAYDAMRHGYVDEAWAREHHEYWYNDIKSGKVKAETAVGMPEQPQVQH